MRLLAAFLRLVRWPNLFFIVLTQFLFFFCIVKPTLHRVQLSPALTPSLFVLVMLASVLIAAAGYIINDYFDVDIDQINKPRKNVVDKIVSRRWAIFWHFVLSGLGVLLSLYVSWKTGLWFLVIANLGCVFLLFGYSVSLKKKLLAGNVTISLLTAWVVMVLCLTEFRFSLVGTPDPALLKSQNQIMKLGFLYAGFAFVISLIREAIKDMEDMEGDERYGCRTMPIVWGLPAAKVYVAVWLVVLILSLLVIQVYIIRFHWWWPVLYSLACVIAPLVYCFLNLSRAANVTQFHKLSRTSKLVMLTGIVSMGFLFFYL